MKIKELATTDRPREKALKYGIGQLSDRELFALLIRTGTKQDSALELADQLLNLVGNLYNLPEIDLKTLMSIKGISKVKSLEIAGVCEIAKRIALSKSKNQVIINSASCLGEWLNHLIGYKQQEHFLVVFLDTKHTIIDYKIVFIGTLSSSIVHPREVFKMAMSVSAHAIILAHNHPSGNIEYSYADKEITLRLIEVGKICGIKVIDHVIVGKNNVFSFREHQVVEF